MYIWSVFFSIFCNSKNIFGHLDNVHVGGIEWSFKTDVSGQITLPSLEILVLQTGVWESGARQKKKLVSESPIFKYKSWILASQSQAQSEWTIIKQQQQYYAQNLFCWF